MKRFLFMSALASVALASCVNDEAMENTSKASDQKITFNAPVVSGTMRAIAGEQPGIDGKYKTDEHFKVYACWSNNVYSTWDANNIYMNGVEVAYDNSGSWNSESVSGGTTYYWPKTGYLTFAAYSPATAGGTISYGGTGLSITGFEVESNTSDQYDLMYSERSYNRTASIGGQSYSGVDIWFKHALSSIKFMVKQKEAYTGTTIKLTGLTIQNAYSKGNFVQGLSDGAAAKEGNSAWTNQGTETHYSVWNSTDGQALTTALTEPNDIHDIILLPQNFVHQVSGGDDKVVSIKVDYTIQNGSGPVLPQTATLPLAVKNASGDYLYYYENNNEIMQDWEMGKRYTYNITIGLDKIYFSPEVVDWVDVTVTPDLTI